MEVSTNNEDAEPMGIQVSDPTVPRSISQYSTVPRITNLDDLNSSEENLVRVGSMHFGAIDEDADFIPLGMQAGSGVQVRRPSDRMNPIILVPERSRYPVSAYSESDIVLAIADLEEEDETKEPEDQNSIDIGSMLIVIQAYKAQDLDELHIEVGDVIELDFLQDSYWWKGTNRTAGLRNGAAGFFPNSHVQVIDIDQMDGVELELLKKRQDETNEAVEVLQIQVNPGATVIAQYNYEPLNGDELQLVVGDSITVIEAPHGGWWMGIKDINTKHPLKGWFPANLVGEAGQTLNQDGFERDNLLEEASSPSQQDIAKSVQEISPNTSKKKNLLTSGVVSNEKEGSIDRQKLGKKANSWLRFSKSDSSKRISTQKFNENNIVKSSERIGRSISARPPEVEVLKTHFRSISANQASRVVSIDAFEVEHLIKNEKPIVISEEVNDSVNNMASTSSPLIDDDSQVWKQSMTFERIDAMTSEEKKRMSCISELIKTERDYVCDLRMIVEVFSDLIKEFLKPMRALRSLGPKIIYQIFCNIEQLSEINAKFLSKLDSAKHLGDVNHYLVAFTTMVFFF